MLLQNYLQWFLATLNLTVSSIKKQQHGLSPRAHCVHVCQSHLWVVLCVPGSQGDSLQIQFTAQIYSRYDVSDRREKMKTVQSVVQKHTQFCGNNEIYLILIIKLTPRNPERVTETSNKCLNLKNFLIHLQHNFGACMRFPIVISSTLLPLSKV